MSHLKDLLHICLETNSQGFQTTFKVSNLGSKQPYFNSAYEVPLWIFSFMAVIIWTTLSTNSPWLLNSWTVSNTYLLGVPYSFLESVCTNVLCWIEMTYCLQSKIFRSIYISSCWFFPHFISISLTFSVLTRITSKLSTKLKCFSLKSIIIMGHWHWQLDWVSLTAAIPTTKCTLW